MRAVEARPVTVGILLVLPQAEPLLAGCAFAGSRRWLRSVRMGLRDVLASWPVVRQLGGDRRGLGAAVRSASTDALRPRPAIASAWFPWYDSAGTGGRDWVLAANTGATTATLSLYLAGQPACDATPACAWTLPAGAVRPIVLPSARGGPLEVRQWSGGPLVVSQRVLTNGAFEDTPASAQPTDDGDVLPGQEGVELAEPGVDVRDHPEEPGRALAAVGLHVLLQIDARGVREAWAVYYDSMDRTRQVSEDMKRQRLTALHKEQGRQLTLEERAQTEGLRRQK